MEQLLNWHKVDALLREWLDEDIPSFDYAGMIVGTGAGSATLYCKSPGVLAGRPFVDRLFSKLMDCKIDWQFEEGHHFTEASDTNRIKVAKVTGPVQQLLQAERLALNILARCSGIATYSRQLSEIAIAAGWKGRVAGTRKTTPGFRLVEKYGMIVGGADTHRMDLSQMVMLKDNHIWSCARQMDCTQPEAIKTAIKRTKKVCGFAVKIEVECRNHVSKHY